MMELLNSLALVTAEEESLLVMTRVLLLLSYCLSLPLQC